MGATLLRALNWDLGYEQRFLAVNPSGDEINVFQTNHDDPLVESNEIVKVHSHTGVEHIQCIAYLRNHVGWTGAGTMDGNVHIFDITKPEGSLLRLQSKHNRPCNSLAFNDEGLIAASFDKSRQDSSVQVWDVTKYARLFGDSVDTDDNSGIRPQHSFLANEATLSAQFDAYDPSGKLLLAGGYKLLREFDLRDAQTSPVFQVATKYTMGLCLDHFQSTSFASHGEDGTVAIWDRRKLTESSKPLSTSESPVLVFPKLLAESLRRGLSPCFRYSTIRRGEFAAIFNGNLIRRWNTGCAPRMDKKREPTFTTGYGEKLKRQAAELYDVGDDSLFVSAVLDNTSDYPRVISFDYSPDTSSSTSTNFVCMREKGSVFRMPAVESIESLDFNSYNDFSITGPEGTSTEFTDIPQEQSGLQAMRPTPGAPAYPARPYEEITSTIGDDESTEQLSTLRAIYRHEDRKASLEDEYVPLQQVLHLSEVMNKDICSVIRQRAVLGYGVECDKNVSVLTQTEGAGASLSLRNTWKWLSLAKKSLEKGTMIREGVDLGFVGVLAMWKGSEELVGQNRAKQKTKISEQELNRAVRAIVSKKGEKSAGINVLNLSDRKIQRKLCLIVSGWYLTEQEFDAKIEELVSIGQVEKAAAWAVFRDDVPRAIAILAQLKKERLQIMSTAVAGYLAYRDSNVNLPWNDQCRRLALELEHPYLRAIFAFISDNDWWDVLDEHALPLRERLGIAIRFLSDKDLSKYLERVADTVVARGELEGVVLTGLTPRGIDLLQSYVDRTSDVQTAALMAQYAVPRYFRDRRVDHWIDSYRELLNSWNMFKTRAIFDVKRARNSKTSNGSTTMKSAPRQVYLQCLRCNKSIYSNQPKQKAASNAQLIFKQFNARLNLKDQRGSKVCSHCGAPLPRCSICLMSLGTPVAPTAGMNAGESDSGYQILHQNFSNKFSFCLSCGHGYHARHAEEWFSKHYVCPVPDCNCKCNSK